MRFPGPNTFDNQDGIDCHAITELTDNTNVCSEVFAGAKGYLCFDYTGHQDLFAVPELTLADSGIYNEGKFISMPLQIRGGTEFANKWDMYVFN